MLTAYVAPILGSVAILPVWPYTGCNGVLKGDVKDVVVIVAKIKRSTDDSTDIAYNFLIVSLFKILSITYALLDINDKTFHIY